MYCGLELLHCLLTSQCGSVCRALVFPGPSKGLGTRLVEHGYRNLVVNGL